MKPILKLTLALLVVVFATGCQSRKAAVKVICNAPNDAPGVASASPAQKAMIVAKYIQENVTNKEIRATFDRLASMSPESRARVFGQLAEEEGVTPCPIVHIFGK